MLWTRSATFLSQFVQVFINHSSIYQKRIQKSRCIGIKNKAGSKSETRCSFSMPSCNGFYIFSISFIKSLLCNAILRRFSIFIFCSFLSNSILPKKIRRIMPDFLDFLYFVCEQGLKTPLVTQSCNIAITPSQATPMASHSRA